MNAREKMTRDFESRKPITDADRAVLAQELKTEEERRKVWDEGFKKEKSKKKSSSAESMTVSINVHEDNVKIQSMSNSLS